MVIELCENSEVLLASASKTYMYDELITGRRNGKNSACTCEFGRLFIYVTKYVTNRYSIPFPWISQIQKLSMLVMVESGCFHVDVFEKNSVMPVILIAFVIICVYTASFI